MTIKKLKNKNRNGWDALVERLGGIEAARKHMSQISMNYQKSLGHGKKKR